MRTRSLLSLLLVLVAVEGGRTRPCRAQPPPAPAAPGPAVAAGPVDEQAEFEKGRNAYRAQRFDEADARFLRMLDPQHGTLHDKVLIKQARMYWAATLLAEHQNEYATSLFETILTEDHDFEPDPLAFPTDVVNAFIDTRARLHEKLEAIAREQYRRAAERRANEEAARQREAARIRLLEQMASEVEVTEKHSRWVALIPFGVGQFQNGQRDLGWFFLGTEATLVAAGVATVPIYWVDLANAHDTYTTQTASIAQQYLDRANVVRYVNLGVYGALAITAITGAIQAEAAYVHDPVRVQQRVVPDLESPELRTPPAPPPAAPSLPLSFGGAALPGRDGRGVSGATLSLTASF
jgi:hypothetical protein